MNSSVGLGEVTAELPQLLERVAKGEQITIIHDNMPVAVLAPPPTERPEVRLAVEAMKRFRKGRSRAGLSVREMIEEGRRF